MLTLFFLASLSTSSADSASDHEFSLGTKTKGGNIGLNGNGTPVTFSHRYSEKAPSVGKSKMPNAAINSHTHLHIPLVQPLNFCFKNNFCSVCFKNISC